MKKLILIAALLLVCTFPAEAQESRGIPVLLYHHVSDISEQSPDFEISVTPKVFDEQMKALKNAGFSAISPQQLLDFMQEKNVRLPSRPIVITFDDGYEDNYTKAFPILKNYGFRATVFMVGINFDRRDRLSQTEIHEMIKAGWTIGSHSVTHPDLNELSREDIEKEIVNSQAKAEKMTDKHTDFFAYPGGFFNVESFDMVENHYAGAFTILSGLNVPSRDNVILMRRIPIFRYTDFNELLQKLNSNQPKTNALYY